MRAWFPFRRVVMTIPEELRMQCLMDHIVLNMEDDEKMIGFYSKVLMLATERLKEYRAGNVPFPSVRMNSETITLSAGFCRHPFL